MKTLYIHFVIVLLLALVAVPNSLRAGSFTFDFEHPNAVGSSFADAVPLNTPGALTDSLGQPIGFTHSPIGATSFSDATLTSLGLEFEICGDGCSINLAIPFPTDGSGIVQITARWSGISSMDVDFDQLGVGIAESNSCCDASAGMLYAITFHNGAAFLGPILYQIAGPFNFSDTAASGEQDVQSITLSAPTIPGSLVTGIFDGATIDATLVQFVDDPANTRLGRADTFAYVFMLDSSDFHGGVSIPMSGILKSVSFSGPKLPPGDIGGDGVTEVVIFGASHFGPEGDSTLYLIDPLTGVATAVGTGIGFQRVSMDFDSTTGILYATGEREAGDVDVNVLLTINPSTGVGTEIGPTGTDGFQGASLRRQPSGLITDISFRPSDQTLFAWAYPGEWVATIDLVSGAANQLAFSPGFRERGITANEGNALAFLGSGILVHAATEFSSPGFPGALHEIDFATTPADQMATVLTSLNFPISPVFPAERFARANGMDFDFANGTLFASIVYGFGRTRHNFLGTIDTTTGDVTLIGQTKAGMDALVVISTEDIDIKFVDINIKPSSDMNDVNPNSNGVVKVAILSTTDFDALEVSTTTIRFGPLGAAPANCEVKDTNKDGLPDLSCKFRVSETGIACEDTGTTLIGATFDGEPFIGTGAVNTVDCFVNGAFETGDLTGWTASGINGGDAFVNREGTCFSFNNTLGLTFNGDFVANVRSFGPDTSSIGILTSDLFVAGSSIRFRALSENDDGVPAADPVTLEVRVLDGVGNVLLSQIVTTSIVTLSNVRCPGGEPRDGIFSTHIFDTSALAGQAVRLEFRQNTNVPGRGFFTLIDDVEVDPDDGDEIADNLFVPSQFGTIQAAVDAASPGDRILVAAGNFAGAVINKQVKISGVGDQTVITDGPIFSGLFQNGFSLVSGADLTEISDLKIALLGGPNLIRTGIIGGLFEAGSVATNVAVHNITFVGLNTAVLVVNTSGWTITDNIIDGLRETPGANLSFGIVLFGSGDCLVANNTINHASMEGFGGQVYAGINLFADSTTGQTKNNKVVENTISVDAAGAIKSNDIELFNGSVTTCDGPVPILVFDNKIIDNDADNILLTPSCLIDFNVVQ